MQSKSKLKQNILHLHISAKRIFTFKMCSKKKTDFILNGRVVNLALNIDNADSNIMCRITMYFSPTTDKTKFVILGQRTSVHV